MSPPPCHATGGVIRTVQSVRAVSDLIRDSTACAGVFSLSQHRRPSGASVRVMLDSCGICSYLCPRPSGCKARFVIGACWVRVAKQSHSPARWIHKDPLRRVFLFQRHCPGIENNSRRFFARPIEGRPKNPRPSSNLWGFRQVWGGPGTTVFP